MKVTFVSNYINHHQMPFCEAMVKQLGEDFCFIQTQPMEEERVRMGWEADLESLPYLLLYYKQEDRCKRLIMDSDVVLFGGVDDESYITGRLAAGKLTIRLSERLYKSGQWKAISPRGLLQKYKDHTRYRKKPVYLLCCGGYVASDFHIVRAYPDKMFQWGYFPKFKEEDIDRLLAEKRDQVQKSGKTKLLWAGRFIDWKHPEYAIEAAQNLKAEGYAFHLTMIGGGELEEVLKKQVKEKQLEDVVTFAGFKKPEEVREYMEEADIFLFTSDYKEGWGAVLNEAMNSGCAVIANCAIGAVPILLKPGQNGLIYPNQDFSCFYRHLIELIKDPQQRSAYGRAAYETIAGEWNGDFAAKKLMGLLDSLVNGKVEFAKDGILSKAKVVSPGKMYRKLLSQ